MSANQPAKKKGNAKNKDTATEGKQSLASFPAGLSVAQRDRHRSNFLHLLQHLMGRTVSVHTMDGLEVSGIFYTCTAFDSEKSPEIVLKLVKCKVPTASLPDGSTLVISASDVLFIEALSIDFRADQGGIITNDLETDGDIGSKTKFGTELEELDGRRLAAMDSSWLESSTQDSLEPAGSTKAGKAGGSWDQFEVNRRLYNVKSTFDENMYTKPLNRSDFTADQVRQAERQAREIEGSRSNNVHLQEERGQAMEREMDEEDLYSGVLRPSPSKGNKPKGQATAAPAPAAGGVNAMSWRKAVTGEAAPSQKPAKTAAPSAKEAKEPATSKPTKAAKNSGLSPAGKAASGNAPPGYDDEYVPVSQPPQDPSPAPEASPAPARPATPPQISFFGTPELPPKAVITPVEAVIAPSKPELTVTTSSEKSTTVPATTAPVVSKLNASAKEFVFTPRAAATAPAAVPVPVAAPALAPQPLKHQAPQPRYDSNEYIHSQGSGYFNGYSYPQPPQFYPRSNEAGGMFGDMSMMSPMNMPMPIIGQNAMMYHNYPPIAMAPGFGAGPPETFYPMPTPHHQPRPSSYNSGKGPRNNYQGSTGYVQNNYRTRSDSQNGVEGSTSTADENPSII